MIDLDEITNETYVYYSSNPISVNRISDVIILPKKILQKDFEAAREPWSFLFRTSKLENLGGTCLGSKNIFDDIIRLSTNNHYNLGTLVYASNQSGCLAILQGGIEFSLSYITDCYITGYKRDSDELIVDFRVGKCETIYDK